MKKFASLVIAMAMLILCFSLSACGNKYVSKYSAMLMVRSNTSNKASVSFDSFSGTYVIQLKNKGNDKVFITYNATMKEGDINVYYDFNNEKRKLFEIGANGSYEGKTADFTGNKTIYIIIESTDKCKEGKFSFTLEKAE